MQQLVQIAKLSGWQLLFKFKDWVIKRFLKISQSQLAEDGFNREKGAAAKQRTRTGREHLAYNTLINSDLAEVVHKFKNPVRCYDSLGRAPSIDSSCFRPTHSCFSVKPAGLVSYSQKTTWYSPSASNLSIEVVDLDQV